MCPYYIETHRFFVSTALQGRSEQTWKKLGLSSGFRLVGSRAESRDVGEVQFASASGQESGKARKRVEQPRRMAVAGRKQCDSAKRVALAYWLLVSDLI